METEEGKRKVESSTPVQSRISVITLAELEMYWTSAGYDIRSMSQLVSWSAELLCEILKGNDAMPKTFESVAEARKYMEVTGLFQPSLRKKGFKKMGAAMRFESLREEGIDPREHVPTQHNILHNRRSVKGFEGEVSTGLHYGKELDAAFEKNKEDRKKELEAEKEKSIKAAKASGMIVEESVVKEGMNDEEFGEKMEEIKERDEKERDTPIDDIEEAMRKQIV